MAHNEILLLKPVEGLGGEGDQVRVRAGFARNFLLPRKIAVPVTRANKKHVDALKKRRAERELSELSAAQELAKKLEKYDPLWFEEPCPPDSPEEIAKVARATSIPISSGERLTSKYEFHQLLKLGAASIIQPDLGRSGGLLETKKIAALAEVYHALVAPHLYCGPVVAAANIQLATCTPNFLILETIQGWQGFHAKLLKTSIHFDSGFIIPPTEPGLGVELNEDVANAHPYDGTALHLEMSEQPATLL